MCVEVAAQRLLRWLLEVRGCVGSTCVEVARRRSLRRRVDVR